MLSKYGIYIAFFLLVILMSILSPSFLQTANIINILRQISVNGIMAVGMTFVMILGGIDLSIGSILAFAAVVAASFAHPGEHAVIIPVLMALIVGLAMGAVNGVIIAKNRVAPFIVTLGMMTAARGLALVYTNGRPVINLSDGYNQIGGGYFLGLPVPVLVFLLIILAGIFILHFTRFGRYVFAIGGNELAAQVSGVNTKGVTIRVYALSGMLAALAGVVLSSRIMSGSPSMGQGYELDVIAAVVIGGTTLSGGVGSIGGTLIGALIIGVMNNGLDLLNVSSYWQQIVKGIIIVLAVLLDRKKNH